MLYDALVLLIVGLVAGALGFGWGGGRGLADCLDSLLDRRSPPGSTATPWAHSACCLSALKGGGEAWEDGGMTHMNTRQKGSTTAAVRAFAIIVGLSLLAMVMTACGTLVGTGVGAGSGAAIGAAAGDPKKGALIGAGVGAAGGAIYDATR